MASTSSSSLIRSSASNTDEWNLRKKYVEGFLQRLGASKDLPETHQKKGFVSDMMRNLLKVDRIERGRIVCHLTVKRLVTNAYGTFHGGTVAGVAELVATACARTVVDEDRELFLGEMSLSYLSASAINVELEVDGCIVKSGRNVTTTSVEFRVRGTNKVVYTAHATFFTAPVSKL
ncbi:acyl-coenzyme A thioesterase 13-like [Papaver somniferum]|uniref:acyl-coenzyme A thioesterase 13-like n=1 Tax=Papaver somniferum TaxID=3469 RepID=UPI000E7026D5|nr:acyl-coenzyme A thioesterase 13-like [Papaver somniferum]